MENPGASDVTIEKKPRYVCVPAAYGLFNVVDTKSGLPAEVDVTAVLLTRQEVRQLILWLETKVAFSERDGGGACPAKSSTGAEAIEKEWQLGVGANHRARTAL